MDKKSRPVKNMLNNQLDASELTIMMSPPSSHHVCLAMSAVDAEMHTICKTNDKKK